jgi:DNA-binding MarR family transcriptional regulator
MDAPLSKDIDYSLWVLLHQVKDAIHKAREQELRQYGITAIEAAALYIIQTIGDEATPVEISRWLFREHHTVTALLKRMQLKGLITKTKDLDRKNRWRVSLTEKGQNACHQSSKIDSIHGVMSTLSQNERQRFESYLRKLRDQAMQYAVNEQIPPFP